MNNSNKNTKYVKTEQDRTYYRKLIWENALELFEKRKGMSEKSIIKTQNKFINNFNIKGGKKSNKYKTIELLKNYFRSSNKPLAEQIFYNSVLKKM